MGNLGLRKDNVEGRASVRSWASRVHAEGGMRDAIRGRDHISTSSNKE